MINKKDICQYNDMYQEDGYWEIYWYGGLWYKCYYVNGIPIGYEELYWYDKKTINITFHL